MHRAYCTMRPSAGPAALPPNGGMRDTCQPLLVLVKVAVTACWLFSVVAICGKAVCVSGAVAHAGAPPSFGT